MGIKKVTPHDFLHQEYDEAVFTQLGVKDYVAPKNGSFFVLQDFYENPTQFKNIFTPYTKVADLMINGIYWDNKAPAFFNLEDMRHPEFNISVIADVTCDIAPVSSIPSTLFASTIANPVFGFDPFSESETTPFQAEHIQSLIMQILILFQLTV